MNGRVARRTRAAAAQIPLAEGARGQRRTTMRRTLRKALARTITQASRRDGDYVLPRLWNEKQQRYVEIMVPKRLKPQRR